MKKLILSLICLAAAWGAAAKVELPEIIGSDMVLQQNAQCRLWGWADPRATVPNAPCEAMPTAVGLRGWTPRPAVMSRSR